MQLSSHVQSLIGQALLGTDKPILDYKLLPEGLRQAVEATATQASEPEAILLKQASLILNANMANATPVLNSFDLATMADYQHALEVSETQNLNKVANSRQKSKSQSDIAAQARQAHSSALPQAQSSATATATTSTPTPTPTPAQVQGQAPAQTQAQASAQTKFPAALPASSDLSTGQQSTKNQGESKERKSSQETDNSQEVGATKSTEATYEVQSSGDKSLSGVVAAQSTALNKALLNKVKKSASPVPLLVENSSALPYLPEKLGKLINSTSVDGTCNLLFWLLVRLNALEMQLTPQQACALFERFFFKGTLKAKISFAMPRFGEVTSAEFFSQFMLQEQMFKLGGASLSFLLSNCVSNPYGSLWPQLASQACLLGSSSDNWDYATLFNRANLSEALGMFLRLRWSNPALSRELILNKVKRLKPDQGMELLQLMKHNLSMEDIPCLTQLMLKDKDWWCINKAREVLNLLPDSPQSQLCAKLCAQYLHFDGAKWQLKPIEFDDTTKAQLESLGLHRRVAVLSDGERNRQALTLLLEGMTWPDLRSLAQTESDEEALKRWATFHNTLDLYPEDGYKINMLLGQRIAVSRDNAAAWAFVQNSFMASNCADVLGPVLLVLNKEQRASYLKEHQFKFNYLDVAWFVELGARAFDFKPLNDSWGLALLDGILEGVMVQCSVNLENASLLGLFLSFECIDELELRQATYTQQKTELKNKLDKLQSLEAKLYKKPLSADSIRRQIDEISGKLSLVTKILKILKAKQRMETALARFGATH